jgi:SAM-dependent methyltransferase
LNIKKYLCCSCNHNLIFTQEYKFHNTGSFQSVYTDKNIYKCINCGLKQADHFSIDKDKLGKFYQLEYSKNKDRTKLVKGSAQYNKCVIRGRVITNIYSNYSHYEKDKEYKFYEFGAGYGITLLELKKKYNNADLFAYEPSDILDDTITKDDLKKYDFDLIVLSHVLEHLHKPHDYIKKLINKLKPGGLLFVEVPNDNEKFLKTKRAFNQPHITFFSSFSLNNMFKYYENDITLLGMYTAGLKFNNWSRIYKNKHFPNIFSKVNYRLQEIMKKKNNLSLDIQRKYNLYNSRINICNDPAQEGYFLRAIYKRND